MSTDHDLLASAPGVYSGQTPRRLARVAAILQAVADAVGDLSGASVIDLGAAEGVYSVELATRCADVVAVEARIASVEKVRRAKRSLGLENLEVAHQDVRELSTDRQYDVVLCLGLLYHLDGPSAVKLCHDMAKITRGIAVVDTSIALRGNQRLEADGRVYAGRLVREFDRGASRKEQEELSWSAIGNPESFWLTRSSLFNLLSDAGFTSVFELRMPHYHAPRNRVALLCFRGERITPIAATDGEPMRWLEGEDARVDPTGTWRGGVRRRLAPYAPRALKRMVRDRRARRRGA